MNKTELIAKMASLASSTKKDAEKSLNAFISAVSDALAEGDKVTLVGFGIFKVKERAARKGRNPQTGEDMDIPASKVPVFTSGKSLKDSVNGSAGGKKGNKKKKK